MNKNTILICVQARMTSSRLPGKVMLPLAGEPLLARMIERVEAARVSARIAVITSLEMSDDPIADLCHQINVECFRGDQLDLLDRHYQAARFYGAELIAKIPSDCPLIDPAVIEQVAKHFDPTQHDYISNLHPASYPDGNDVEILTMKTLERAWHEATQDFEREHTTPYIWERPSEFRIANVRWQSGLDYSMTHRWTIDYPEDYEFIRTIYDALYDQTNPIFSLASILHLLEEKPEITGINRQFAGVNWYRHYLDSLRTVQHSETRFVGAA